MAVNRPTSPDDISDIRPDANGQLSPTTLPIRGEKRVIPTAVNPATLAEGFQGVYNDNGMPAPNQKSKGTGLRTSGYATGSKRTALVEQSDFYAAFMAPYVDYMTVRLPHRGVTASKDPADHGKAPAVYRFLINPAAVSISRQTIDGQAMTRAGWQIGVWGEDAFQVTLVGKTAGQYFAFGLTDQYQRFTESYRNLEQLQMVFENNGYFFEGEQAGEGPLAADFTRRRIKMHEDVELIVGNFMWYGMFDTLTVTQSADAPFLASFNIVFTVWRERFRPTSPYASQIPNNVHRGHSYGAFAASPISTANGMPGSAAAPPPLPPSLPPQVETTMIVAPAVLAAQNENTLPNIDPTAVDYSPVTNVQNRTDPVNYGFWQQSLGSVGPTLRGLFAPFTFGGK
jgi:hypothetical protein